MEFDELLEYFADEAGQKEEIALIFFWMEEFEDMDSITQSDVKRVIRSSRSSINPKSVSSYFSRLENSEWITPTENSGYRLTHPGEGGVKGLLPDGVLDEPRDEEDRFIDTDDISTDLHQKLIDDINLSYRYRIYDGTMVLTRKFFEDIVFKTLKNHYGGDNVQKYYDEENGAHYSFDELLSIYKDSVRDLRQYSRDIESSMLEDIRELKNAGNLGAHSIRVDFTDDEMEDWSTEASRLTEIFYEIFEDTQ